MSSSRTTRTGAEPRHDHREVDQSTETCRLDAPLDVRLERVAVRKHTPEQKERAAIPSRGSANHARDGSERPQRRTQRHNGRMRMRKGASATFIRTAGGGAPPRRCRCPVSADDARVVSAGAGFLRCGLSMKSSHSRTARDDGAPEQPPKSATASQPSRRRRSLTVRHQTLPGGDASSGLSRPRRACQCMNDSAARRNGRCRGARPVGPWVRPLDQGNARSGIVPRGSHLRLGVGRRASVFTHPARGERGRPCQQA